MGNARANEIPLGPWLAALNRKIRANLGRDARNQQVGQAYLMPGGRPVSDFAQFARIVQDDILPLLEEYCYEDYAALAKVLGNGLVDEKDQRLRHELFAPERMIDLVQALLQVDPQMPTESRVVQSSAEAETSEEPADDADAD